MEAAVRLAAKRGFAKTRVSDVVGEVGVGQGVFYWYFESKEALFREVLEDTAVRLRLYQGAFIADERDSVLRVAKGILATFEFIAQNRHTFALLDHASAQARWRRTRAETGRIHTQDIVRHLQEGMERGEIREADPELVAESIRGVVDRIARNALARGRTKGEDLDSAAQEAIDFCVGGLAGDRRVRVSDLRREIEITPASLRIRDRVGAGVGGPDLP